MKARERVVVKLSGSVFSGAAASLTEYGKMFSAVAGTVQPIIVAGGGKVARDYIATARSLGLDEASLDIMGIEVSRLNAKLIAAAIGDDMAYHSIPHDLEQVSEAASSGKAVVSGGLHPGQSTNATAALIAEKVGARRFLNATDVDGIYDSDPKNNPRAKMFKEITLAKCLEILSHENAMAGAYDLMDIVALKVIERSKIPTVVLKATPENVRNALDGKQVGTRLVA